MSDSVSVSVDVVPPSNNDCNAGNVNESSKTAMSISLGVNAGNVNESYKKAMSISLGVITQIRVQSSSPWLDVGCLDVSWLNTLLEG